VIFVTDARGYSGVIVAYFPCHHILLTPRGETVNSFCQWGTEEELETALRAWLERSMREVEA
jgi:hypothetical protein